MTRPCDIDVAAGTTPHAWLWLYVVGGWQIVRCRHCGKHERYRPMGFATEYPGGKCHA